MIRDIAYTPIAGLPVAGWVGILSLSLFLIAAAIQGLLRYTKIRVIPVKWHPRVALTALIIAIVHMVLALSAYLGY